mgnify:CR=1 FL=1
MERKHRLSSLLSIVIIVIVLALIGKNMKVTAFIEDTFISGCLRLMSPAMLFYDKPQLIIIYGHSWLIMLYLSML